MRSQGRTEQRALLALDGAEDMQGGYVQLTRSTQRTDLYLTVGPEPLGPDDERPHPSREARAPEELLARVLTRDGSKTLATDTPDRAGCAAAVHPASCGPNATGSPSSARRVRRTAPGSCGWPPGGRPRPSRPANRPAPTSRPPPTRSRRLAGRWRGRRELAAARERLVLAEHALRTTTGQADQAAERLGLLRRAQQRHLGWLEAHDAELRVQERAVAREDAWRRRVDQHALALDPPGWLLAELGPVPTDPERAERCGAWPPRNWTAIGAPTAWITPGRRSIAGAGWLGTGGRRQRPPGSPAEAADGTRRQPGRHGRGERAHRRGDRGQPPTMVAGQRHQVDPERLLGAEPRRQAPGRRRDWQAAQAALERLAGWSRHRHHRDQPHPDRADRDRPGRRLDRTGWPSGTRWPLGAGRREQHMGQHPNPDPDKDEDDLEELGTPFYQGNGLSVRALTAEELQQFLDAHADQPAELLGSGWAALDRPGHPLGVPRTPPGAEPAPPEPQPALPAQQATGSLGHPGRSALTQYRRRRAAELAAWTRSLTWRAPLVLAAGLVAGALAAQAGLPGAGLAGLTVAVLVGWRLRFRPSTQARAWQRGAKGERHTARLLDRLGRDGYVSLP